ncbi:MAG: GTPase HflX [Synechococcaceae cyanobacterium]|nr:GTPase HflX [Synechococcaceae cyanobacterium]
MRQGVLAGRTAGLRPSSRRRLEQLCHRRHPVDALADLLTLERLAAESRELALPLTLVVDGRGLGRLLWVGDLEQSGRLLEKLPGTLRRQGRDLRLLTCTGARRGRPDLADGGLGPQPCEAMVGLDVSPLAWLRWPAAADAGGSWPAALYLPAAAQQPPWNCHHAGSLESLSLLDPASLPPADPPVTLVKPGPSRDAGGGMGSDPGSGERVLLLALTGGDRQAEQRRLAELEELVRSAGARPVGLLEQRRSTASPATVWGEGKVREAALEARRLGADLVVTDRELTPVQARNLERLLDLPVSDRSELILDIFAQRAASAAGRLQVELAQLRYRLPRLAGRGLSLSRQGGGIGSRGPGETQLEQDRRAIARRIERLQRQVQRLGDHRARLRQHRHGLGRLALVGYTNAGKSSLLNALSRATDADRVLAENKLFATLDPTTRRLDLGAGDGGPGEGSRKALLLTDTVGFIRDLPPQLVEAFRSTLEETLEADGLLLVANLSDPDWPDQLAAVRGILDGLGSSAPRLVIGNQIDRCPARELERARALEPEMLFVSATAALGLRHLRQHLRHWPPEDEPRPLAPVRASLADH